jgi:hypothetical protein
VPERSGIHGGHECKRRQAAGLTALVLLAGSLVGCGGNEVEERKAFVHFLQTRILDKQSIIVPQPTEEEKASFGPYAAHYDIMLNFVTNADPFATYRKLSFSLPTIVSSENMFRQRAENRLAGRRIADMLRNCDARAAEAKNARAALKQPEDLKAVYDAAFEKTVIGPVRELDKIASLAQRLAKATADFGDYLYVHPDKVQAVGNKLNIADALTRDAIGALVNEINAAEKLLTAEQARLLGVFQEPAKQDH